MKSNKKQITNCERKTKKNLFAKQNTKEDNKEKKILLNIVKHENSTTKNRKRAHFFTPNQKEEEKHYEIEKMELFNADL